MAIFSLSSLLRGAVILGSLLAIWKLVQLRQYQHLNIDVYRNSTIIKRQLVVPSLPAVDSLHVINHHGDVDAGYIHTEPGAGEKNGYTSPDKNGNNLVDVSAQSEKEPSTSHSNISPRGKPQVPPSDFAAKKKMFETGNGGVINTGSSGKSAHGKPAPGTVSNLKGQFEAGNSKPTVPQPNPARMRPDSDAPGNVEVPKPGVPAEGTVSNLKGQFEGDSGTGSKPNTPESNPAPVRPGSEAQPRPGNSELPRPGTVQDLKNKFENPTVGDSASGLPTDPVLQDVSIADQLSQFSGVDANGNPILNPAGRLPGGPGTVSDLKNQFENPTVGDSASGPPTDPVLQDVSIVDQLKEFSSVDVNGNPINPTGPPRVVNPAPKQGHHEKINSWEKLPDKEAKNRPEATYDLDDPALNPRPPFEPIAPDAGLDIDLAVKNGMEAVRKQNPDIKKMDNEINDILKNMQKNAAAVKDADAQIAKIKETQAIRDLQEKEMMQQKSNLDARRKRLAEERAKLAKENSRRQEERTLEAKDQLMQAYRDFGDSLARMASTVSDMKAWTKTGEVMLEQYASDLADWKSLDQAIKAERAARRAASKAKNVKGKGKTPPEVPPIVESAKIENGQIASIKTNVPPPNVPLPEPLPDSIFETDHVMRMALDDIRIEGKLTLETADMLVREWGMCAEAEEFLKENGIEYDNMALAKGAIAGVASTAHLLPVGAFVAAPEALEMAALAGSPEILAAAGIGMAAPEIASTAAAAVPAINAAAGTAATAEPLTEEGVKQAIVAAQVVGVGGKDVFIKSGKKSLALLAVGGTIGAGLGTSLGLMVAGIFARKRAKNEIKNAASTVRTTVLEVISTTIVDHITKIVGKKTTKTKGPKPTPTKASETKSEKSVKPTQSKTSSFSTVKSTSASSSKSTVNSKTTAVPSSTVSTMPKETGKGPVILPPVILPLPPYSATDTTNSTTAGDNSTQQLEFPPVIDSSLSTQLITNGTNSTATLDNSTQPVELPPMIEPELPTSVVSNGTNATASVDHSDLPVVLPTGPGINGAESAKQGSNSSGPADLPLVIEPILPTHELTNAIDSVPALDNSTRPSSSPPDLEPDSTRTVIFPAGPKLNITEPSTQQDGGTHPATGPLCPSGNSTELIAICRNVTGEASPAGPKIGATKTQAFSETRPASTLRTKHAKPSHKPTNGLVPAIPGLRTTTGFWNRTTSTTTSSSVTFPTAVTVPTTLETLVKPTTSKTSI